MPDASVGTPGADSLAAPQKNPALPAPPVESVFPPRQPGLARRGVRAVGRAPRSALAWSRRPSGRVIVPGVVVVLLLGLAGTAGAYLVPRALEASPAANASPAAEVAAPVLSASAVPAYPTASAAVPAVSAVVPTFSAGAGLPTAAVTTSAARPADALAGWAQQIGTKVGIPVVAVQAYGYAELVVGQTTPSCHLSWTTLAAIGEIESNHGSANGAVLGVDGVAQPTIYGLPLDGQGGRSLIADTDQGTIDGDTTYDRAVGPMQFIPSTWRENGIDADRDGVANPSDIDDAALTAATYLCKGGRDMSKADSWWEAILSYNALRPYAQKVFAAADDYGTRSRS
ncbi:lytic murein transglycosylase [Actinoplanes sp. NPDC051851]|uniref:lytic transglycosylase domain-containing protein n=1 Tax=Actinoplanes sp. NPDC051851 TaxID=3154753 RepID=UPI00342DA7C7